jgi:hypothetical protein
MGKLGELLLAEAGKRQADPLVAQRPRAGDAWDPHVEEQGGEGDPRQERSFLRDLARHAERQERRIDRASRVLVSRVVEGDRGHVDRRLDGAQIGELFGEASYARRQHVLAGLQPLQKSTHHHDRGGVAPDDLFLRARGLLKAALRRAAAAQADALVALAHRRLVGVAGGRVADRLPHVPLEEPKLVERDVVADRDLVDAEAPEEPTELERRVVDRAAGAEQAAPDEDGPLGEVELGVLARAAAVAEHRTLGLVELAPLGLVLGGVERRLLDESMEGQNDARRELGLAHLGLAVARSRRGGARGGHRSTSAAGW